VVDEQDARARQAVRTRVRRLDVEGVVGGADVVRLQQQRAVVVAVGFVDDDVACEVAAGGDVVAPRPEPAASQATPVLPMSAATARTDRNLESVSRRIAPTTVLIGRLSCI
jgi:hypothetical protein